MADEPGYLPSAGDQIGGFTLLEPIGHGAMGQVYRAHDETLGREVAIKFIDISGLNNENLINQVKKRFIREARVLAAVNHPNVIEIFTASLGFRCPYIVMQFFDGMPLFEYQDSLGVVDYKRTCVIGLQICEALDYCWENYQVMHRDLKPANIMISQTGHIKIIDWGIAKVTKEAAMDASFVTKSDMRLGTPYFMAPEQQINPGEVTYLADIYSMGMILWQMLAGDLPFSAKSEAVIFSQKQKGPEHNLTEIVPDLPPNIAEIIYRMLESDPLKRISSYAEIRNILQNEVRRFEDAERLFPKKVVLKPIKPTFTTILDPELAKQQAAVPVKQAKPANVKAPAAAPPSPKKATPVKPSSSVGVARADEATKPVYPPKARPMQVASPSEKAVTSPSSHSDVTTPAIKNPPMPTVPKAIPLTKTPRSSERVSTTPEAILATATLKRVTPPNRGGKAIAIPPGAPVTPASKPILKAIQVAGPEAAFGNEMLPIEPKPPTGQIDKVKLTGTGKTQPVKKQVKPDADVPASGEMDDVSEPVARQDQIKTVSELEKNMMPSPYLTLIRMPSCRALDRELFAGKEIGNYSLIEKLGTGSLGVVMRAEDTETNRQVAFKALVCDPDSMKDNAWEIHEAEKRLTMIQHHGIAAPRRCSSIDGFSAMICELYLGVDGRALNLDGALTAFGSADGTLNQYEVRSLLLIVLDALAHAHSQGAYHGNLKPENIIFPSTNGTRKKWYGDLKLTDLGLSTIVGTAFYLKLVRKSKRYFNTPQKMNGDVRALLRSYDFMSPEQRYGSLPSVQTDIYQVGLLINMMLTGRTELTMGHRPSEHNDSIDPDWDHIILRALKEDPDKRYRSTEEMAGDIANLPF